MMLDFIAGKPDETIDDLQVKWSRSLAGQQARPREASELLTELRKIEDRYTNSTKAAPAPVLDADDAALLQLVKNALNAKSKPASATTIAYTNLYIRGQRRARPGDYEALAHPELVKPAWRHRITNTALLAIVLVAALIALWESASVALGKSILQARLDLRVRQAAIATEKLRAETSALAASDWALPALQLGDVSWFKDKAPHLSFDFCERPRILAQTVRLQFETVTGIKWPTGVQEQRTQDAPNENPPKTAEDLRVYETPQQQEICDWDLILRDQFRISTAEMAGYVRSWPSLVGNPFEAMAKPFLAAVGVTGKDNDDEQEGDTEIKLAPRLLVHGNFILPVLFAFLGAAAHVVLEFYTKMQASTLTPHDRALGAIRLVLGLVVGTCIGLAFSSVTPAPDKTITDLVASLSLTASGVSFLAGFGVEGVFDMLREVVKRVFPAQASR
ncbi:hypothetical protein [Rhodopila sp.]|uniref:hypothetical protein n=1 Tax=Rhodopila sp. TaxID=2480087 RepID=UPI003D0EFBE8